MKLNSYIDHTLLKADANPTQIEKLCAEAIAYNFCAVCVNGSYVKLASDLLKNSDVKIASVIGFPLGASTTKTKVFEAKECINNGANEIDMVLNIGMLKSGDYDAVSKDISEVKKAIGAKTLKVILETCYLTNKEIKIASKLAMQAGTDFIKTSTGFGTGGATIEDVKLMKEVVGDKVKIKASGGIKNKQTAKAYINLGVCRIGTSSGIEICS